jgi:hypothetical protein
VNWLDHRIADGSQLTCPRYLTQVEMQEKAAAKLEAILFGR